MKRIRFSLLSLFLWGWLPCTVAAQELDCKVTINHAQIQGTNVDVFKDLENAISEFMNERTWTNDQYSSSERISCALLLTVKEYSDNGTFVGEMIVQSNRPVYHSSYISPVVNIRDNQISFTYNSFDRLVFRIDQVEDNLTSLLAYYAYLIIGWDMDTLAPFGGTSALQNAEAIVNAAQTFATPGWKAYDDAKNRHGILTDYLNESMKSVRQMMYDYHRLGLDEMAANVGRGRAKITSSLEELEKASKARSMSAVPQLLTEIKRDELINVYSKAPSTEKEKVYEILSDLNPSLNMDWDKIKAASN